MVPGIPIYLLYIYWFVVYDLVYTFNFRLAAGALWGARAALARSGQGRRQGQGRRRRREGQGQGPGRRRKPLQRRQGQG